MTSEENPWENKNLNKINEWKKIFYFFLKYGCSTSFLTFVEIVKRSNSCIFSSATSDLFCSAKYEISNSLIEMGVI